MTTEPLIEAVSDEIIPSDTFPVRSEKWKQALEVLNLPAILNPARSEIELTPSIQPDQKAIYDRLYYTVDPAQSDDEWDDLTEQGWQALRPDGFLVLDKLDLRAALNGPDYIAEHSRWTSRFARLSRQGFSFYRSHKNFVALQKSRQNVLYLAPWVTWGGSDKGTIDWFRHLDHERYRLFLITTQVSPNAVLNEIEPYAEEIWPLPDLIQGQATPQFILEFIATRNIHLVHIMNSRLAFDLLPLFKAHYPHLRIVVQHHNEEEDRSGYCRYVATRYSNLIDAYSLTSYALRDAMRDYEVSPGKMDVIYTGVDARHEFNPALVTTPADFRAKHKLDRPGLHILFPARLDEQKNPFLMLEVAEELRQAGSKSLIHVVGDGVLRAEVEKAVRERRLEDRVMLHGPSRQMPQWYKNTDLVLLTSRYEGVPFVIFEAMAMERPVVVSAVGANHELVDETTGYLIQDRTQPSAYVKALLELENQPEHLKKLGHTARHKMLADFSVEGMARRHEDMYYRLFAQHLLRVR